MWRSEVNLGESVLSIYHVIYVVQIQILRQGVSTFTLQDQTDVNLMSIVCKRYTC